MAHRTRAWHSWHEIVSSFYALLLRTIPYDTFSLFCSHPDDESAGSSLFLEPMSWMAKAIVGEVEGKMYCPNTQCKARLGSFNWSGGFWVVNVWSMVYEHIY